MNEPLDNSQVYPVLEEIMKWAQTLDLPPMDNILFVCVQHLLQTTDYMFEKLFLLGVKPENVHILGKTYSSSSDVVEKFILRGCHYYPNTQQSNFGEFSTTFIEDIKAMWDRIQQRLIHEKPRIIVVLDDGGACLTNVPDNILEEYVVVGVEQTSSGRRHLLLKNIIFPIVDVASSAVKQFLESPMIASTVTEKIHSVLPVSGIGYSCLVIGLGVIGQAVTKKLLLLGYTVFTFDENPLKNIPIDGAYKVDSLSSVLLSVNYIFGCSGQDITEHIDLEQFKTDITFISCSSQDKEFFTLLRYIAKKSTIKTSILEDINFYNTSGAQIKICRGGFPVNFDQSRESVKGSDIQLTRGLLLSGVIQAIILGDNHHVHYRVHMLEPMLQKLAVYAWKKSGSVHLVDTALLTKFSDNEWIKQNSGSHYSENSHLNYPWLTHYFKSLLLP